MTDKPKKKPSRPKAPPPYVVREHKPGKVRFRKKAAKRAATARKRAAKRAKK